MIKSIKFKPLNLNTTHSAPVPLKDKVSEMVQNLCNKVKSKELDSYYYEAINENIQNLEKDMGIKAAALSLKFQEKNKHMLEISVLHPSMEKESTRPLFIGNQKEILEYLTNENFVNDLIKSMREMSARII